MEFWYCVMTFSLLILISEANKAHLESNVRNLQSSSVTFTAYEYDPTLTDLPEVDSTTTNGPEVDPTLTDEPEVVSAIHTNGKRITRVIKDDPLPDKRFATLDDGPKIVNRIQNVFRNIFETDDHNTCYFGEVFQRKEQYYEFNINPRGSPVVSIGFGYAWKYEKLKGRTAEFVVNRRTYVLLSKNDNSGDIKVEIQSGSEKVVLTSPEDPQYRPVVCLKGEVHYIKVRLFNGMKMASIPSGTAAVDLPIAGKKLKALMNKPVASRSSKAVNVKPAEGALAFGVIETHTLTSTTPHTYLFTGCLFDSSKWWMSPNLVDEDSNWGNDDTYSEVNTEERSFLKLTVWPQGQAGHSMKVYELKRRWERKIYVLYDSDREVEAVRATQRPETLSLDVKDHCSGVLTCGDNIECHWPRSDRQNLLPGVCIDIVCKYMIEARKRTGLYKLDGERTIGDETALRLITPKDVGVHKKGIPVIKALLKRAEDFGDINPTGDYEFGGLIDPPSGASGPQKRYFNNVDLYLDVEKSVCEEKEKFIRIKTTAGIIVGFGKYINFFEYTRCSCEYSVVKNLVTNSLDPIKDHSRRRYENKHYQRVDPNRALDKYESEGDYDRDWPQWPATLPKELTENLYYNNEDSDARHYYSRDKGEFFDKDRFSAVSELSLGLSSAFKKCVDFYFFYDYPVYHVTTFVRQRMQDGNPIGKNYTEFYALLWHYGLNYSDIDFSKRKVTAYNENNVPSWIENKNGDESDVVEASYTSLPALLTDDDLPPNPWITQYKAYRTNRRIKTAIGSKS